MSEPTKTCQDCHQDLRPIKILDSAFLSNLTGFVEAQYTTPKAVGGIASPLPISGTIKGWICPECSRITLYGEPKKDGPQP